MKQQPSTASDYKEACDLLRSGYVKHVRLGWNVESDELEEDIDNQHTEEESVSPFTPKEIKALRKLLKKRK